MRSGFLGATCLLAALATASAARAVPVTYDFDDQAFGATTPLAITKGGLTATFTSPGDDSGFTITSSFYQSLSLDVLASPGPNYLTNLPLVISFSRPVTSITLNFAIDTQPAVAPLGLLTDAGGIASADGVVPAGFLYPEGVLTFIGAAFTSVTLDTTALTFAIDNLTVNTVPEPAGLALLGLGLLGAVAARRRIDPKGV